MAAIKTPLANLNELMTKKRIIPEFELINSLDATNRNILFSCKVSCDGLVATGIASSKKEAKQEAAKQMLEKIAIRDGQIPENSLKRSFPTEDLSEDTVRFKKSRNLSDINVVGALINLCSKKYQKVPEYKIADVGGPAHMKVFSATCTVSKLSASATGNSKREAKTAAAIKMWELVNDDISQKPMTFQLQVIKLDKTETLPETIQPILQTPIIKECDEKKVQNSTTNDINSTNGQFVPEKIQIQDENVTNQFTPDSSVKNETILETDENNDKPISSSDEKTNSPQKTTDLTLTSPAEEKKLTSPAEEKKNIQLVSPFNEKSNVISASSSNEKTNVKIVLPFIEKANNNVTSVSSSGEKNNVKQVVVGGAKKIKIIDIQTLNPKCSPLMKYMQLKANSNSVLISEGNFKKNYSEEIRLVVLKQVILLLEQINVADEITQDFVLETRHNFMELLKPLKLTYKCKQLPTKSTKYLMLAEISTNPDINEVGIADSIEVAEINSIKQILQLLTKLL